MRIIQCMVSSTARYIQREIETPLQKKSFVQASFQEKCDLESDHVIIGKNEYCEESKRNGLLSIALFKLYLFLLNATRFLFTPRIEVNAYE